MNKNQHFSKKPTNIIKSLIVLALFVLGSKTNSVVAQDWSEVIKAVASDRGAEDDFGRSVAISGEYAIVGAKNEDHDIAGENSLNNAGSAYIFKNTEGTWTQVQKMVASERQEEAHFGSSVDIFGDYAVVGAYHEDFIIGSDTLVDAGSAYIFKNTGGTWTQVQKIVAPDREIYDEFGYSVSISDVHVIISAIKEGGDIRNGSPYEAPGSAYVFKKNGGIWGEVQKIVSSNRFRAQRFGSSVAISGDYAIVGADKEVYYPSEGSSFAFAGSVFVFKNVAGTWEEVQKIVASDVGAQDHFGNSVAISEDYVIVGASLEDHDTTGGDFRSRSGSAYIFKNTGEAWGEVQKIVASDREASDRFGSSVAISGEYAIIGAPFGEGQLGSTYIFKNNGDAWSEVQKIVASDRSPYNNYTYFGTSVAISGYYSIVGVPGDNYDPSENRLSKAGSAYFFKNCPSTASTDVQIACDAYTWIDGNTYTSSNNTATHTLTNATGCDSVVTLNLTINSNTGIDVQTVCDSYTWIDGNTYTSSNNTATHTLTNAAGCDSIVTLNLTVNSNTGIDVQTVCDSYTWIDGNTYTSSNNTATHTLTNAAGCDSIVTLNLTINSVSEITTTTSELTISANNINATYQWLDCNNANAIIPNETEQTFTATTNGNYAVEITENGCVDTSACTEITTVGIESKSLENNLTVYPNPTKGNFGLDLGSVYGKVELVITDVFGRVIETRKIGHSQLVQLSIEGPKGLYFIRVQADNKKAVIRLVKE